MTPAKFASYVRFKTKTNSTTLTDANLLLLMNTIKDEMSAEVAELNEDLFIIRSYRDLVADQRIYALPNTMLTKLKYVEAILDGTNQEYLSVFDLNGTNKPTDETNIKHVYANKKPQYDLSAHGLNIFSGDAIIAVTNGLIIHATQYPQDISDLTLTVDMSVDPTATEFGLPRPMHLPLARRVVIEYKEGKDKPMKLTKSELNWEQDWEKVKGTMKNSNLDDAHIPSEPVDDGQEY